MPRDYGWTELIEREALIGRELLCELPANLMYPYPYEIRGPVEQIIWLDSPRNTQIMVTCGRTAAHVQGDNIWCWLPEPHKFSFFIHEGYPLHRREDDSLGFSQADLVATFLERGDVLDHERVLEDEDFFQYANYGARWL